MEVEKRQKDTATSAPTTSSGANSKYLEDLELLLHEVKKQPELFQKEMVALVGEFKDLFNKVKENPTLKNERFIEVMIALCQVGDLFPQDLEFVPRYLIELLENYASIINPLVRFKVAQGIICLRARRMLTPFRSITLLMKLLILKDKQLRQMITRHLINDVKRLNNKRKNPVINKQIQTFIFEILKNASDSYAKRSLNIMIELYRRQIWNDDKCVNIIASGCFNENPKVIFAACYFLHESTNLSAFLKNADGQDSDDETDDEKHLTNFGNESKNSKKKKSKEARKQREMKRAKKRLRRKLRDGVTNDFFPIDKLYNPQTFGEQLFGKLRSTTARFEIKLAMMSVLGRLMGRHKLLILNFYPFVQRYLNPHQREVSRILALVAESIHDHLPSDEINNVLIKHIIDHFCNERNTEEAMVTGLNAIREMCTKNHFIMDEFHLNYLADLKEMKRKNVSITAKSLVNLYREVNPGLLAKKYRGIVLSDSVEKLTNEMSGDKVFDKIDGIELLEQYEGCDDLMSERILTDHDFRRLKFLKMKKETEERERRDALRRGETLANKNTADKDGEEVDIEEEEEDGDGEWMDVGELNGADGEEMDIEDEVDGEDVEEDDWSEIDEEYVDEEEVGKKAKDINVRGRPKSASDKSAGEPKPKKRMRMNSEDEEEMNVYMAEQEGEESDDENPHGFVDREEIEKHAKKKKLSRYEIKMAKKELREEFRSKNIQRQKAGGGSTNDEKLRNKPLMMVRPKVETGKRMENLKQNIKKIKRQLGHFKQGKLVASMKRRKI